MRLTERDLELLRWINGHGFVTGNQVADWMGASMQAAHRRLGLLHQGGYLLRERLFHSEKRAYRVSALGHEISGDTLSRLEMISPAIYRHNQMLVDLAHAVTVKTGGDFTPERRLRQSRADVPPSNHTSWYEIGWLMKEVIDAEEEAFSGRDHQQATRGRSLACSGQEST